MWRFQLFQWMNMPLAVVSNNLHIQNYYSVPFKCLLKFSIENRGMCAAHGTTQAHLGHCQQLASEKITTHNQDKWKRNVKEKKMFPLLLCHSLLSPLPVLPPPSSYLPTLPAHWLSLPSRPPSSTSTDESKELLLHTDTPFPHPVHMVVGA